MGILDKLPFQIMGWYGPNYGKFTPKSIGSLAEAGFTATFSLLKREEVMHSLDLAQDAGMRLVIGLPDLPLWHTPNVVDEAWLQRFREFMLAVRHHPALLGYFIVDEPYGPVFDDIGRAYKVWKETDPDHLFYVNQFTVGQTYWVACSYEDLWERLWAAAPLEFVSADGYPVQPVSEADWEAHRGEPNYYARQKARLMPHYFEMLDLQRHFAARWKAKLWAFTMARGEYSPATAEGEMRFQLMTGLAYGAKGLQYFAVEAGNMLIQDDGSPTENLRVAKALNTVIRTWAPTLMKLRSIGVYHHPANLFATRPLDQFMLGAQTDLCARGDAIVVGHFLDEQRQEHALICNRNPFEPAVFRFHFGTDEAPEECSPVDARWSRIGFKEGRWAELALQPGEAKLFRFTRPIQATQ